MSSPAITARSADLDLFGRETDSASTPIAKELQAHFDRGGSVAEAVHLVAALERAGARISGVQPRSKQAAERGSRLCPNW